MKFDKRLLSLVDSQRASLVITVAASLAGGLAIVLQARLLSLTIGQVFLQGGGLVEVQKYLLFLFFLVGIRGLLVGVGEFTSSRLAILIKTGLREELLAHLQALGPAYLKEAPDEQGVRTGEVAATAFEGVESLEAYFAQYLPQLAAAALVPLTLLVFIFPLDRLSGFILLLTAPLIPVFMVLIGDKAEALTRQQWSLLSRMSAHFLDVLQGLPTLKLFGRSQAQIKVIARVGDRYRETTLGVLKVAFLSALALELVATLSTAVVAVEIGLRVLSGRLAFENALFVLLLAPEFYLPLRLLGSRFHAGMSGIAAAENIFSILETPVPGDQMPAGTRRGAGIRPAEPLTIKFEEVTYTFPGDRTGLGHATFHLPVGKITALVGSSGAGKSTLVDLLLRFLQPQSGQIWLNSTPLGDIAPEEWRQLVSWVPQNPYLFNATVADNIRLGQPEASPEEISTAAKNAYAHEFVRHLPQGYQTRLGEQAARLSTGQAQRLALARAFLQDAPVLILDEPGAHLDPHLAFLMDRAIQKLAERRTVLIIAHRLPTIYAADHLVLLEQGRVVDSGSPTELLNREGKLRSLFGYATDNEWLARSTWSTGGGQLQPANIQSSSDQDASELETLSPDSPPDQVVLPASQWNIFSRLVVLLRPFWGRACLSILLGFATTASFIGLMATSAYLISAAALQPSIAALQVAIVGVRFFGLSRAIFRYLERYLAHDVTLRLLARLRTRFYAALEPLAPARLQQLHGGDILSRINSDLASLEIFFVRAVLPPGAALLILILISSFLAGFSSRLALLLICLFLAAGIGLPVLVHWASRAPGERLVAARSDLIAAIVESIQGMADLQAFNAQARQLDRLGALGEEFAAIQKRLALINSLQSAGMTLLSQAAAWGILFIAIPLVSGGQLSGVYLAVLVLAGLASFEAVAPLPGAAQALSSSLAAARRLFSVIDARPEVTDPSESPILLLTQASQAHTSNPPDLEVRHLSFGYPQVNSLSPFPITHSGGSPRVVLDDISFSLPVGKKTALVGASGIGKTTLVNLLARFWDYQEGEILLSGFELHRYQQEDIRAHLAIVPQQIHLFNATIRENLLIARPGASQAEIDQATRLASIHEFIASLPQGYETWIGEQGLRLSGGERQRLAIARALLRDAPILILDEPTAHLDAALERDVLAEIIADREDQSVLLITHRLVGLDLMDEILVLSQGRIVERGQHADLLSAKGYYWKMQALQNELVSS